MAAETKEGNVSSEPLDLEPILERAFAGEPLTVDEGLRLLAGPPGELPALLEAAGELRDRAHGRTVTWSRKVFLPITNLCRDRCAYCTFRKSPCDEGAWTMSPDEIRETCERGARAGCKEALMCLGDRPESAYPEHRRTLRSLGVLSTAEYVELACDLALEAGLLPHTNAGVLERAEMQALKRNNASMGLMLESAAPRLREKGQAHGAAPDKDPARRLRMIREAGELRIPFTTGLLVGIGESLRERVETLAVLRELAAKHGHVQEILVQNFRAKPDVPMRDFPEPGAEEMARTVAVARLMLGASMNLQAPPNLSPDGHRLLLRAGINDWGGLSPVTRDYINPESPWPHAEALARTCEEEGFELVERLAIYPEFVERPGFLDEELLPRVRRLQDELRRGS